MEAVIAVFIASLVGLIGSFVQKSPAHAGLAGCIVMPVFVLFVEFVLSNHGGGASMWPIALVVGSIVGCIVSFIGVGLAKVIRKFT